MITIYEAQPVLNNLKFENIDLKKNLYQINILRAFASVSVCLFHLVCGNPNFLEKSNPVYQFCSYGYLGVYVFFIVSGFIICYSLPQNYQLNNFGSFLKKRLKRVEPPYLVSILFTLLVAYSTSFITNNPVTINYKNILYHLAYINNFTSNTYINIVYWTLGIEFQFYILIGLLFTWMNKSINFLITIIFSLLALSFVKINHTSLIFEFMPLFCVGILMFYICCNKQYSKLILTSLLAITLTIIALNQAVILWVSLFTICILLVSFDHKVVQFLSNISYSLYLVHVPVGGRIINLSLRFVKTDIQKYLTIAVALVISISVAYFFYLIIEKPAIKWSKQTAYRGIS